METRNVGTFSALKQVLAEVSAGDEIYITADMDASNDPITSDSDAIVIADSCTIYGNGHTIYNITNTGIPPTSTSLIHTIKMAPSKTCTWQDTNFYNIFTNFTNPTPFMTIQLSAGNAGTFNVTNCNFQGQFGSLLGAGNFSKCTVNGRGTLARRANNLSGSAIKYNYIYSNLIAQTDSPSNICYMITANEVNNCYFTGSIDTSGLSDNDTFFARTASSNSQPFNLSNCIINVDIKSDTAKNLRWTSSSSFSPKTTLYNSSKTQNITFAQTSPNMIAISDSDLKNAEAVAATGFPIIT